MAQITDNSTVGGKSLLDYFYPVGTIYETMDAKFNPSTFWGGTWEKVSGRFLYGSEDGTTGSEDGEKTHTLTIDEMPSHTHDPYISGTVIHRASSYMQQGNSTFWNMAVGYEGNYSFGLDATGGGERTTICLLTSLLSFGRELLRKFSNEFLSILVF